MKKFIALALLGFALGTGTVAAVIIPAAVRAAANFEKCQEATYAVQYNAAIRSSDWQWQVVSAGC